MKINTILLLYFLCASHLIAQEEIDHVLETLKGAIELRVNRVAEKIPKDVKIEVLNSKMPFTLFDISEKSQNWIDIEIMTVADDQIVNAFESVRKSLANKGNTITNQDYGPILKKAIIAKLNDKPFNLNDEIDYYVNYWREITKPNITKSPDGLNEIDWLWTLKVESRSNGILHVGLDTKKRTFICYENTVGLYFPEGDVMERIYSDIVQDQLMASEHLGRGRKITPPHRGTITEGQTNSPVPDDKNPLRK